MENEGTEMGLWEEKERENACRYWLHCAPGIGPGAMKTLVEKLGSAWKVYQASCQELRRALGETEKEEDGKRKKAEGLCESRIGWELTENYRRLLDRGIRMVSIWEEKYPQRLRKIANPPVVLYYLGSLPDEERASLAIVGARECSDYGSSMAQAFGAQIAACGVNIISGMARGIDGISQKGALAAGGSTYAVLGCGVDICYPASNRELYEKIPHRGGVLSPYPPGMTPARNLFPYRNRIVAGLADAVLVVEARQKSGTWITVDMALEQGKDVYAVPGRLTDRLSDGCNLLIRQGAGIALAPGDVAAELSVLINRRGNRQVWRTGEKLRDENKTGADCGQESKEDGNETEKETKTERSRILALLDLNPLSVDEIFERAKRAGMNLTLPQLLTELVELCTEGMARQTGGSYFAGKRTQGHCAKGKIVLQSVWKEKPME